MQQEEKDFVRKKLQKYKWLCLEVRELEEEIDELRNRLTYHRSEGENRSGSGGDKMAEAIARLVDLTEKRHEVLLQRIEERDRISAAIDSLEDPEERMIIHARYIQGKPWNVIYADFKDREWRTMFRVHTRALESIAKYFKSGTKCHKDMD